MKAHSPVGIHVVAVLVALTAALVARAALQVELREAGIDPGFAADLSYLVVPPLLALLLTPVVRARPGVLKSLFQVPRNKLRLVVTAVALGVLLRLSWWSHMVAGVAIGVYRHEDPAVVLDLSLAFHCPPAVVLVTGLVVMAVMVPVVEEIIHRGFVQEYLYRFGPVFAIGVSAVTFTVFHPPGSWLFVFFAGLVFGTQFWITRSLWSSLITHATINALVQLDWRCLQGQWNPPRSALPDTSAATIGVILLLASIALIIALLLRLHRGEESPR